MNVCLQTIGADTGENKLKIAKLTQSEIVKKKEEIVEFQRRGRCVTIKKRFLIGSHVETFVSRSTRCARRAISIRSGEKTGW